QTAALKEGAGLALRQVAEAGESLRHHTETMKAARAGVADESDDLVRVFTQQTGALKAAAQEAESSAQRVRLNSFEERRDAFLRTSKLIMEDLTSAAIDLNRILNHRAAERL